MNKTKTFIKTVAEWILNHAVSIMIILAVFWAGFLIIHQTRLNALNAGRNIQSHTTTPPKEPKIFYSAVSGVPVESAQLATAPVTAIMIENSPSARPQSGLKNSGVVYEAVAEGGITRFLVIYQVENPDIVGPVRSLRPYYIEWLKPYDASVAHVGGSKRALDEVRNGNYRDIDQFFNPGTYWRASDRRAPHNVYTSFEKINALNAQKGFTSSNAQGFLRVKSDKKDPPAQEVISATKINIGISSSLYNPSYNYDADSKTYLRFMGGKPHIDREDGQIAPRVVITMFVKENTVNEDGARENIITTGKGRAVIFQNGTVRDVFWERPNVDEQIKFIDEEGKSITLERGQTWISAVPEKGSVSWE